MSLTSSFPPGSARMLETLPSGSVLVACTAPRGRMGGRLVDVGACAERVVAESARAPVRSLVERVISVRKGTRWGAGAGSRYVTGA
jgi:hypothetical protein